MKKCINVLCLSICAALAPTIAGAQAADSWQFGASLNVYLPTIKGTTTFAGNGGSADASIDSRQILDALNMTFMATLDARKGRWGAFTDVLYLDLGNSRSGTRDVLINGAQLPVGASANANLDIKGTVWTLGGYYRAVAQPNAEVQFLAGARMLDLKEKADWTLTANIGSVTGPGLVGSSEVGLTNWDLIVGAKGRFTLGDARRWFVPYYVDVGTGQSKSTFQAMTGIGYSYGWGDLYAGWRYLDYRMKSDSPIHDVNMSGPQFSAVFRW